MNSSELLFFCFALYFIIASLSYMLPKYENIYFLVRFSKDSKDAADLVKGYRNLSADTAIILFMAAFLLEFKEKNMFSLSCSVCLYILILFFAYCLNARRMVKLKEKPILKGTAAKAAFDIGIKPYYYILHLFFIYFMFYFANDYFKRAGQFLIKKVYISPVTALFLLGVSFIMASIVYFAPPLANNKVKKLIYLFIYLLSLLFILFLLAIQCVLLFGISYIFIFNALLVFLPLLLVIFKTAAYIKEENRPYEFKVYGKAKAKDKRMILTSLNGTKVLINTSNKKSCILITGLIIYFLSYFFIVYFLMI